MNRSWERSAWGVIPSRTLAIDHRLEALEHNAIFRLCWLRGQPPVPKRGMTAIQSLCYLALVPAVFLLTPEVYGREQFTLLAILLISLAFGVYYAVDLRKLRHILGAVMEEIYTTPLTGEDYAFATWGFRLADPYARLRSATIVIFSTALFLLTIAIFGADAINALLPIILLIFLLNTSVESIFLGGRPPAQILLRLTKKLEKALVAATGRNFYPSAVGLAIFDEYECAPSLSRKIEIVRESRSPDVEREVFDYPTRIEYYNQLWSAYLALWSACETDEDRKQWMERLGI